MRGVAWLLSPVRRALDVVAVALFLVVASPLLVGVAVAVRVRLGSPVLFRQQRAGRGGVPIDVVKFRSMTSEVGADGSLLPDADRLTRFGSLLRATSLDELPQLFAVVRGDMSLIGPRPLPLIYLDRYSSEQRRRVDARPGITGWSQVNGRNALAWHDKLAFDVWYIDHATAVVDLKIIAMTLRALLGASGVRADGHATMPEFLGDDSDVPAARTTD